MVDGNSNSITGAATVDFSPNLNQYTVEMNINSKDGKTNYFSDIYGPYNVKTEQALVFGQQYKYNPEVYNDEYQIQTKIYRGGELVTENKFDVEMDGNKTPKSKAPRYIIWFILALFILICFVFILLIITKKKGLKKKEI